MACIKASDLHIALSPERVGLAAKTQIQQGGTGWQVLARPILQQQQCKHRDNRQLPGPLNAA